MQESLWFSRKTCLPFISICNHDFLIFNNANLAIASINHCLCLGLTKTDYKMSFNCAVHSTHVPSLSTKKFEMKLLGCEILGTAARTLAPLTNFPRAMNAFRSAFQVFLIFEMNKKAEFEI